MDRCQIQFNRNLCIADYRAKDTFIRLTKPLAGMRKQNLERLGVYAGSFDPPAIGHLWMIEQAGDLFNRLIVAVGVNPDKKYTFSLETRLDMPKDSTKKFWNVSVASFSNRYLIHDAQSARATPILRGIRCESDYEFERTVRNINGDLDDRICTV